MLLEIAAQQRRIQAGLEAEVVADDHRLHVGVQDHPDDPLLETRHGDGFINERVFRTAQLPQFGTPLPDLFRRGIITDNEHLEVRFDEIARVKVVLRHALVAVLLAVLAGLPGTRATPIGAGDDRLGNARGQPRKTGVIIPAQGLLESAHQQFPRIGMETLDVAKRGEQGVHRGKRCLGGRTGGSLRDQRLARVRQFLPAITAGLAGTEHAGGVVGGCLGGFCCWCVHGSWGVRLSVGGSRNTGPAARSLSGNVDSGRFAAGI